MEGGVATGFRHVERGKYESRFFIVKKIGRRTEVKQIPMRYKSVNSGDVFIMDLGLTIYQFNGAHSSKVNIEQFSLQGKGQTVKRHENKFYALILSAMLS